jgi:Tfp pilus assembly protein PilF
MANDASAATLEQGMALHRAGRLDEAAAVYQTALASAPGDARVALHLGVLLLQIGKIDEALEPLRRAATVRPDWPEARNSYGVVLCENGQLAEGIVEFRAAIAARPDAYDARNNLASAMLRKGDADGARDAAEAAAKLDPKQIEPLLTLASAHLMRRDPDAALEATARARMLDQSNDRAVSLYRAAISRIVQPWHFPMLNDGPRNDAYEAAIRRAVTPDTLVLDIGAGSGLLSMMAARAGAKHVVTCERTVPVARKARQIVAQNGLADRITVHAKQSNALAVGTDMPGKADVLVSEILDSDLLSEGVLPSLEDAHARLIKPGAKIIPQAASAVIALAGGDQLAAMVNVGTASGFNVSAFNEFMPDRLPFDGARFKFDFLSKPAVGLHFDFRQPRYRRAEHVVDLPVTRSGLCLGVVQWLHVQLDEVTIFENPPGGDPTVPTGWVHLLHTFAPPVQVEVGQKVRVVAGHSNQYPYFQLADIV